MPVPRPEAETDADCISDAECVVGEREHRAEATNMADYNFMLVRYFSYQRNFDLIAPT